MSAFPPESPDPQIFRPAQKDDSGRPRRQRKPKNVTRQLLRRPLNDHLGCGIAAGMRHRSQPTGCGSCRAHRVPQEAIPVVTVSSLRRVFLLFSPCCNALQTPPSLQELLVQKSPVRLEPSLASGSRLNFSERSPSRSTLPTPRRFAASRNAAGRAVLHARSERRARPRRRQPRAEQPTRGPFPRGHGHVSIPGGFPPPAGPKPRAPLAWVTGQT